MINIHNLIKFDLEGNCKLKDEVSNYFEYFKTNLETKCDFKIIFKKNVNNSIKQGLFEIKKGTTSIFIDSKNNTAFCDVLFPKGWLIKYIEDFLRLKLINKNSTFIHASTVSNPKTNNSFSLIGWHGSGKTTIMMHLLNQGYSYLSDDKAIIKSNGEVLAYPTKIRVHSYNIRKHKDILKPSIVEKIRFGIEDFLNIFAKSKTYMVHSFFNYFIDSVVMAKRMIKFDDYFKGKIIESTKPKIIVLEKNDSKPYQTSKLESLEFITKIKAINIFEWEDEIIKDACNYDFYNSKNNQSCLNSLIEINKKEINILKNIKAVNLTVPSNINPEKIEKILEKI